MKNVPTILALLSTLGLAGLTGCSSSRTVAMNSLQPAEIAVPGALRTLLIVDRTGYHDGTVGLLEGILTGEVLDEDRAGLQAMVDALRNQLSYSDRFITKVAGEVLPGNSLTRSFPAPLEWTQIDALMQSYSTDLALCIEIFDSDFVVTHGRRVVKKTVTEDNESKEVEVPEFHAEGVANLTIGIRLYDPRARDILDEDLFSRSHSWKATGSSVRDAVRALIAKADAANYLSRDVGTDYAYRIAPMPVRISRTFYGRSKRVPEMEQGGRHADVGDWRAAVAVWESALDRANPKEAGKLSYNIAIACEVLGEWDAARHWAQQSYVRYGNTDAREYLRELNHRVELEEVAVQQMQ